MLWLQRDEAEELEIATLLLDAGYQLDDVPYRSSWYKFGGTAIKMAAEHGATDIVQLFLDRGADPDIPGSCLGIICSVSCSTGTWSIRKPIG